MARGGLRGVRMLYMWSEADTGFVIIMNNLTTSPVAQY